ncbi:nuclear transport factor 2 family protein [Haliea sp. E1-2-M8]|uniref:nuclear transport factor 2 family protein n=1 Tax=Haliea sp. E1-2-M8 TaxID=3064706 RepID=UPI0027156205|nr:nuclear transport factor 2 family protein [Haliea sp. E1-2-M8]MDO8860458.1 nuclear transport factor 2 family protein [Haliea sp. E1-2-M8]
MTSVLDTEEKLAIHELLSRAAYALDERDVEMLAASFAEDASFSMRIAGGDLIGPFETREGIMQLMTGAMAEQTDKRRHVVSNIFFPADTGSEEGVTVVSNLTLFATENGAISLLSAGVYQDRVVQREGVWQLLQRHLELDKSY